MKTGRRHTIIFLRHLAALGEFPGFISEIRDKRSGQAVYVRPEGMGPDNVKGVITLQDVPDYFEIGWDQGIDPRRIRSLITQKTYVVDLERHRDMDAYLDAHFGKKSRSSLRRYKNRLENCFKVEYQVHQGEMDPMEFNSLFERLEELMAKRFRQKGQQNYELQHLEEIKRDFRSGLGNGRAAIFVIRANGKAISIRLNLLCGTLSYYILSAYDPDYELFRIGKLDMWQNIQWLKEQGFKKYDLLKGYAYIKENWADSIHGNRIFLIGLDPYPIRRMHFELAYWRKAIWFGALWTAKYLGLEKAIKKLKRPRPAKPSEREATLQPLPGPPGDLKSLRLLAPGHGMDRLLVQIAYRYKHPVADIQVFAGKNDPYRFIFQLGNQWYSVHLEQNLHSP